MSVVLSKEKEALSWVLCVKGLSILPDGGVFRMCVCSHDVGPWSAQFCRYARVSESSSGTPNSSFSNHNWRRVTLVLPSIKGFGCFGVEVLRVSPDVEGSLLRCKVLSISPHVEGFSADSGESPVFLASSEVS